MDHLLVELRKDSPKTEGPVFQNLMDEYQKVILRSLVATFGLDFLIRDQVAGDVDTVDNVRSAEIGYKNLQNASDYANKEIYNSTSYHNNPRYSQMKSKVKRNQELFGDAYLPGKKIYYGKASHLEEHPDERASLDHIVSAKEVHEDPGRVLAGLNGTDLVNSLDNLYFKNVKLNSKKWIYLLMSSLFLSINERDQKVYDVPQIEETPVMNSFDSFSAMDMFSPQLVEDVGNYFAYADPSQYEPFDYDENEEALEIKLLELIDAIESGELKTIKSLILEINDIIIKISSEDVISITAIELINEIKSLDRLIYDQLLKGVQEEIKTLFKNH